MHINILVIAGSDSSGGAGIQADIKTINNLGCHAATAITALTAQNSQTIIKINPTEPEFIAEQIKAICDDMKINIVKIGMVYDISSYKAIFIALKENIPDTKIILDPVFISSTNKKLVNLNNELIKYLKEEILPQIYLLTPNLDEANMLLDKNINNIEDMKAAINLLKNFGCEAILLKGGHLQQEIICDILLHNNKVRVFESKKILGKNNHGSGCSLASAISAYLAKGNNLEVSIDKARKYVYKAIENAIIPGQGIGSFNHIRDFRLEN